jgi:RNA recognition motif-containing protein
MGTRVFVGNVSRRVSEQELERFFSQIGDVASVAIPVDRATGEARGFAFVEFRTSNSAEEAMDALDGATLDGRSLRLSWAVEKPGRGAADRTTAPARRPRYESPDLNIEDDYDSRGSRHSGGRDDYGEKRRGRPRKGGRHGSDRRRGRGTRRVID